MNTRVSKAKAIAAIKSQIEAIPANDRGSDSPAFKRWHSSAEATLRNIFGDKSEQLGKFQSISYFSMLDDDSSVDLEWYRSGIESERAYLTANVEEIEEFWPDSNDPPLRSPIAVVEKICRRFHRVARSLQHRHGDRTTITIADEYDVQDLLLALLRVEFDDIRPEECTPSYAGGSARMDFLLKDEQIVIEVKKTRKSLGAKEIGDELLIDIGRYKSHENTKVLVCFVYDPDGIIRNPGGLENDLSRQHDDLVVRVIVAPRGD